MVKIINGVNEISATLEGRTVADARAMLAQALNIGTDAVSMVAGQQVADDYQLVEGDELEFVKPSGTKG